MRRPVRCRMRWTRLRDGRVGAEAEDVHLDQAQGGDVVLVELDDHHPFGRPLERGVVGDGPVGDDEAPQVRAQVHGEGVEALDQVEEARVAAFGRAGAPGVKPPCRRAPAACGAGGRVLQRRVAQLRPGAGQVLADAGGVPVPGHVLGEGVDLGGGESQGLGHDPDRRAGAHGVDVGHHSHVFVSESLVDVFDHLVPARGTEVHVDVGHLAAVGVEEPLEQQVVADRLADAVISSA